MPRPRAPLQPLAVLLLASLASSAAAPSVEWSIHKANEVRYREALRARYSALRGAQDPASFQEAFAGRFLFDLFIPAWRCPYMERVGTLGDGGKWVASLGRLRALGRNCTVMSFGAGTDISFESAVMRATDCTVYLADPTVNLAGMVRTWRETAPPGKHGRLHMVPYGLRGDPEAPRAPPSKGTAENASDDDFDDFPEKPRPFSLGGPDGVTAVANAKPLDEIAAELGVRAVSLLKVDVEGAEWSAFKRLTSQRKGILDAVDEILVEVHRPEQDTCRAPASCDVRYAVDFFSALEARGFRIFSYEPNHTGSVAFAEFALIRRTVPYVQ